MKKLTGILLICFIISCGKENNSSSTDGEKTTTNKSDTTKLNGSSQTKDSIIIDASLSFEEKANKLRGKYEMEYKKIDSDKSIFPERFENKWKMKFFCENGSLELYFFEYEDTTAKQNVMNNWLNCFGNDCITIKENEKQKGMNNGQCFVIINEKEIVYFGYECQEHEMVNDKTINEIKLLFSNNRSKYISINCNGRLDWK